MVSGRGVQGNAEAQFSLGLLFELGLRIETDAREAEKWFRRAAERGHADAQFYLGMMYEQGRGVARNYFAWYGKAAERRVSPIPRRKYQGGVVPASGG